MKDDKSFADLIYWYCPECEDEKVFMVDHKKLQERLHDSLKPRFDPFEDEFRKNFLKRR